MAKLFDIKLSSIFDSFYDKKNKILEIISKVEILFYDFKSNIFIFKIGLNMQLDAVIFVNYIIKDIDKNNNIPNFANFLLINKEKINIYSFYSNNLYSANILKDNNDNFFSNKLKTIYEKPYLDFFNAKIIDEEIYKKKYFEIKSISEQLKKNYKFSLEQKKENVIREFPNFNEKDDIYSQYINLIKLVIQDNTNKELILKYLKFLEKNETELLKRESNIEIFNDEYDYYNVILTQKDIKDNFKSKTKQSTEKDNFINLLKEVMNTEFSNLSLINKNNNINRFNQPITNENIDLYWFGCKCLIDFVLSNIKNETDYNKMKFCISKVLSDGLFNKQNIINDKEKIVFILVLFIFPINEKDCLYNLSLLNSKEASKEKSFLKETGVLIESILNTNFEYKLNNYYDIIEYFDNKIGFKKIKNFLKKVLCSKVFRQAFSVLYPEYLDFPFDTYDKINNYIEHNLHFIPLNSKRTNGYTNKLTMEIYIFLKTRVISGQIDKYIELLEPILYTGPFIKTNYYEINHNFYNMFFFHSNGTIPVRTPRKKINEEREECHQISLF